MATALSALAQAASVTVNTEADVIDTAECTLREAIVSVNQNSVIGGCAATGTGDIDTVELPAGDYVLSIIGLDDNNAAGDLDVLADLTLNGQGADTTSISAQGLEDNGGPERVMHINPLGSLLTTTINDVTIRDGLEDADGGGILIEGAQLNNLVQGIAGAGTLGSATLNGVNVVDNESDDDAGGILAFGVDLILDNVFVSNNISPESGGGLEYFGEDGGSLQIRNSTFDGNQGFFGAGISAEGESSIDSTTISNNFNACAGGGLFIEGLSTITNSTISNNRADNDSCGIATGAVDDRLGGGVAIDELSGVTIVNSTISGNFAIDGGGGIAMALSSPAAPAPPVAVVKFGLIGVEGLHLFNVTIADNVTDGSGGGVVTVTLQTTGGEAGLITAANTILANNSAGTSPDCAADFVSEGYNLVGDTAGCNGFTGTGDQTGVDPQLGPLQDNGGPTFTQALLAGSPAIDTADPSGCSDNNGSVLNRDQRGETRPVAILDPNTPVCDIGAFEFQIPEPTPSPTPTATPIPGFLLNGTGCALIEGAAPSAVPALLALLAGLGALAYRYRRAE
ncbi:MAG TPA: right-handed parallel beta-helix repeat-containing protein [bacterium]|nr:right-handed parallel beta-helix repeat-containing protein [bacterium]